MSDEVPMFTDVRTCYGGPHDGMIWETVSMGFPIDPTVDRFVYIMSEDFRLSSSYERGSHPRTGAPALIYRRTVATPQKPKFYWKDGPDA